MLYFVHKYLSKIETIIIVEVVVQVICDREQQLAIMKAVHAGIGTNLASQSVGGHHGMNKCRDKITKRYYWPRITSDIRGYIRSCEKCQRAKQINLQKSKSELKNVAIPNKIFSQIGIDLMGLMPVNGMHYILTVQDHFTKWVELIPLPDKAAPTVAEALFKVFCRYGYPDVVISDRGKEFNNELSAAMYEKMGTNHRVTSAYHPQVHISII